ncbi:MAG TPA: ABC-type transport auxiliary lipoprotein family protein [Burkholderiales bacterium]|nr:ABC-type transport auxiliary lipoprotein family protein [Burkholderiales bacterium]
MKARWLKAALGALVAVASGCTLFSPAQVETRKEVLSETPLELPVETTRATSLLVLVPQTRPIYDTTQMAYSTRPYEIAYFSETEWAEKPSRMIQGLLVETLRNTHYFSAVLTPPYSGRYTHVLRSEILELRQDFTSQPAMLQLDMRFQLSGATGKLIASKDISIREPMREKTASAGVVAANQATAKLLRELARFVVEKSG